MSRRTKLSLAALAWLLATSLVFVAPVTTLSSQWRWALLGILLLPLLLFAMALAEGVVEGAFLVLQRVVFYALTFGKARVERESEFLRFPWYGVSRGTDGKWVMEQDLAGFILFALIVGIVVALYFGARG